MNAKANFLTQNGGVLSGYGIQAPHQRGLSRNEGEIRRMRTLFAVPAFLTAFLYPTIGACETFTPFVYTACLQKANSDYKVDAELKYPNRGANRLDQADLGVTVRNPAGIGITIRSQFGAESVDWQRTISLVAENLKGAVPELVDTLECVPK